MEADFSTLRQHLYQWDQRRQLQMALVWLPRGVLVALLTAATLAVVSRWRPLLTAQELVLVALGLVGTGFVISLLVIVVRRRTLWQQARFADQQFRLRERAATAVELYDGRITTTPSLAEQQLADTLTAVGKVDTPQQFPLLLNQQDWMILLVAAVLLAVAIFLPNPQEAVLRERRAVAQTLTEQAAGLEALQEAIANNQTLTPEQQAALQAPIEQALQELQANGLSREEAVAVLSEAEANLRELDAEFSQESLRERLEAAGQTLSDSETETAASLGEALQNGQLGQAGAAAAQLADDLTALTHGEQEALADDLAETAASLQNLDSELADSLQEAADALEAGDMDAAQEALREAGGILQERQQEAAASQQAGNAAQQLAESRNEVAQAGESSQSAEASAAGEQSNGEAAEGGNSQAGEGDSNSASGTENGVTPLTGSDQAGAGAPASGGGTGGNVFVPDPVDLSGIEGTDIELPAECVADPESCGPLIEDRPTEFGEEGSLVPYEQVFGDYRDAANEALSDDYIPLGLKDLVRDYFSSLEP